MQRCRLWGFGFPKGDCTAPRLFFDCRAFYSVFFEVYGNSRGLDHHEELTGIPSLLSLPAW